MRVHILKCFWKGFLVNERIWGLMERQKQDTQKWNLFWTNFGTPNLSQCLFVFDFVNSVDAFTKPTCLRPCLISCLLSCACEVTVLASWTCEFQLPCLWIQKNYCNCQWLMLPTKLTDCVKNLAVPWLKWLKEFGQTQCQNLDTNWVITAVMRSWSSSWHVWKSAWWVYGVYGILPPQEAWRTPKSQELREFVAGAVWTSLGLWRHLHGQVLTRRWQRMQVPVYGEEGMERQTVAGVCSLPE